jgi:hypothetical protein
MAVGALAVPGHVTPASGARCDRRADDLLAHALPTVSHDRMLLKVSLREPQAKAPELRVGRRRVAGLQTDTTGTHWAFHVTRLEAGTRYTLDLRAGGCRIADPWELTTFPSPDACPDRVRVLVYTCAGGLDLLNESSPGFYVSWSARRRLFERALAFAPDAAVAIGDHVYWDQRVGLGSLVMARSPLFTDRVGVIDRSLPVLGTANEGVLKRAVGPQIAELYGTLFRSVPTFFLRDDHDYFEDDVVTPELTTFPPDRYAVELARASQWLYYPEFLPDPWRPLDLPGSSAADRPRGASEGFGTLRYGQLVEMLLYDCKGFVTTGPDAHYVPATVESWLRARMADPCLRHVVNVPSNPIGYTAGKYMEWYADVVETPGEVTDRVPKAGWQPGWRAQHDRLVSAMSGMRGRVPLVLSGDIHSIAEERIVRAGPVDLRANPLVSVITGTPATGVGWPSLARGTVALPPTGLEVETVVPVQELNGFHLVDFEPDRVTIRHFRWDRRRQSEAEIDTLEPFQVSEYRRPA